MKRVRILTIGNEVLLGAVLDSNSNWLCKQIAGLGGEVTRISVLPDHIETVGEETQTALSSSAHLIVTIGGLGPTADDLTLAAIAQATGRPLSLNQAALSFVESRYASFLAAGSVDSAEMTPERRKMAHLPQGAVPLSNFVGAAPGVLLRLETGQIIVALPGVPGELQDIFCNALAETLKDLFGSGGYVERTVVTDCKDESALAPILRRVCDKCPTVYIKSRPKRFGNGARMQITLAQRADSMRAAATNVDAAQRALEEGLNTSAFQIVETKT